MKTRATHITDPEGFARRVLETRERTGYSQRELAFEGCSYVYISRIENGHCLPSLQITKALAERLGVSVGYLLNGDTKDPIFDTTRAVIYEHLRTTIEPDPLIMKLDKLTQPYWYRKYAEWRDQGMVGEKPKGVPWPVPRWARRYYAVSRKLVADGQKT